MVREVSDTHSKQIVDLLLKWFASDGRDLPWRKRVNPYRVWVSETMLQQTQALRVSSYFPRFLEEFPTLSELSRASWRKILPIWRGLGYYGRAKNMLKTARILVADYQGRFPRNQKELESLPGIGAYTASAIRAFAFRIPTLAIDTNVKRVITRVYAIPSEEFPPVSTSIVSRLTTDSVSEFNHALMDLGAMICLARKPKCPECPLSRLCLSHIRGLLQPEPRVRRKLGTAAVDVGVACIHRNGKYLIAKRTGKRGKNWEFPGGKRESGETIRNCLKREVKEELGIEVSVRPPFLVSEMQTKTARYRLHFCRCQILRGRPRAIEHSALKWITADALLKHSFPAADRDAVEKLCLMK